jgi:hypothetical protein
LRLSSQGTQRFTPEYLILWRSTITLIVQVRDDDIGTGMAKPYHLMTPAERTAARIAQNRAMSEKTADGKDQRPPVRSTDDYSRATPAERAKLGSVIRKLQR